MLHCIVIVYYNEDTEEVEQCFKEAKWQGQNQGFACDEHKECLIEPIKPVEEVLNG